MKRLVHYIPLQAALKAAKLTKDGRDGELAALRAEFEVRVYL